MFYTHITQLAFSSPLKSALINPTNIGSFFGIIEKILYQANLPRFNGDKLSIPFQAHYINLTKSNLVLTTFLLIASLSLFGAAANYSRVTWEYHPAFLAANYIGLSILLFYHMTKNSMFELNVHRNKLNKKEPFLIAADSNTIYSINPSNPIALQALKERYHGKISLFVFKVLAFLTVFTVSSLGAAGIMDMKRVSQIVLGLGTLGYFFGTYLLRLRLDYYFFKAINNNSLLETNGDRLFSFPA